MRNLYVTLSFVMVSGLLSAQNQYTKTTSNGVSDPVEKKIRFTIQDEDTKNIIIVSNTDKE